MNLKGDQQIAAPYINLHEIDQFDAFRKIVGYTPEIGKYYKSLFRPDKTGQCRYALYNGILFFVDNASYKGKLSFNLIETVEELYSTDTKGALFILASNNIQPINKKYKPKLSKIDIKFEAEKWKECDFIKKIKIPPEYLNYQNVYFVKNYWCNTKQDSRIIKNRFYKPSYYETIAYYFKDTDKVKLYWHQVKENKFYTNVSTELFGEHRYDEYIGDDIFLTKSGKDDLVLNYHLGLNTLGVQTEHLKFNRHLINLLKPFENIYIWYDNDKTGKELSEIRGKELKHLLPNHNIYLIYVPSNSKKIKDPSGIIENNMSLTDMLNTSLKYKKIIEQ
jgi:hypothetical protein